MNTTFEQIAFIPEQQKPLNRARTAGASASRTAHEMDGRTALRLRERLLSERGFENFDDTEILSTVLSYASGTKNTAGLVAKLLDTFGSLKGILEARPEQLLRVEGMNRTRASLISMIVPMARVWIRTANEYHDRIGNSREAEAFCRSLLIGERLENFFVVALNAQCKVIGKRRISTGSLSEVSAYPRLVMETALNYNAHSVLLCHNHPGGTCAPSPEDISSTVQLQKLLHGVGILVLDHIIVANDNTYSMVMHNDISYRMKM